MKESDLRRLYVAACTLAFPDVRLFIRNVGTFQLEDGRVFKAGVRGMADVWGLLFRKPRPVHLEIELKSATGKLNDAQLAWRSYCIKNSVPYLLLQAVKSETAPTTLDRWIKETESWLNEHRRA